jgi:hypothetical protein
MGWKIALGWLVALLPLARPGAKSPALPGDGATETIHAALQCEPAPAPGRVRCEAELRAKQGAVRWADVEVVSTPEFIVPLKGRTGPREATTREDDVWRWGLGLVARERGEGDVVVRLRAVVCSANGQCTPEVTTAKAHLLVGRAAP